MKIAGFGDSFITPNELPYSYTNIIAGYFNTTFEHYGKEGSGAWDAYFQLEQYLKDNPAADVILFVWSSSARLYHPKISNICYNTALANPIEPTSPAFKPIMDAAKTYYEHLHVPIKADMEHYCLYYWIDTVLVPKYPNTKFIHMRSFPNNSCDFGKPKDMEYLYEFTTAVEIRPALIHLSYLDEWPEDLSKETRCHHMTPKMHKVLADNIIHTIEDYKPGLLNIKL
jgi:hypothetical protein